MLSRVKRSRCRIMSWEGGIEDLDLMVFVLVLFLLVSEFSDVCLGA